MPLTELTVRYSQLVHGDTLIDRSGNDWMVSTPSTVAGITAFGLRKGDKVHSMQKSAIETCTIRRQQTHAEHTKTLEDQFPSTDTVSAEQGEQNVQQTLGGTVQVQATAEQVDDAESNMIIEVVKFETEMDDLERRTHLYLFHGIHGDDAQPRSEVINMHAASHGGKIRGRVTPHGHV